MPPLNITKKQVDTWDFLHFQPYLEDHPLLSQPFKRLIFPIKYVIPKKFKSWPLAESDSIWQVVSNHGDRKSPKWGCGTPSKWPKWLINCFLTGVILQVKVMFIIPPKGTYTPEQMMFGRRSFPFGMASFQGASC